MKISRSKFDQVDLLTPQFSLRKIWILHPSKKKQNKLIFIRIARAG